jgi:GT2 family glycosyltransferase
MQLSVIILNYNVRYFLELCLTSVLSATQNIESEIIVIDNCSEDDSCAMVKARFPIVKLIQNQANEGFPKGNNIGVAAAKGKYICILNPDTVVAEDTFEHFLQFANEHPAMGIMGCKLLDGAGNFLPESKRSTPTPWVALTKIFGLYKMFPNKKLFNQYYAGHVGENQIGKVAILVGAFMAMKRDLYLEVGGFDEACFMYSDDIDLSYQIIQKEYENYYNPHTQIIHFKGESTSKDKDYINRFQEAMEFFYAKHFKKSSVFSIGMKIGSFIFVRFKAQKKIVAPNPPEQYLLFSNQDSLQKKLKKILQKKILQTADISTTKLNILAHLSVEKTEIIFDTAFLSFKQIIHLMNYFNHDNFTFKFVLPNQEFLIGSNYSESKGEVIKIN